MQARGNQAFAKGRLAAGKPGYAYGSYWYQVDDGDGSVEAGGRFGQKMENGCQTVTDTKGAKKGLSRGHGPICICLSSRRSHVTR